jgi:hypothetical protein
MKTRSMGQNSELEERFQQLQAEFEKRNASLEKKQDDQFAFMSAKMDQLLSSFTELQKGMEQKDRSVSFDSIMPNVGSTSKGGRYADDGGGFRAGDGKGWRYAGDGGGFHAGDGFHTKSIRLEFPKFDGEDPLNWCYKAEQFFDHYATPEIQRLKISSFHMEGTALIWFQELHKSNSFSTWEEFAKAL